MDEKLSESLVGRIETRLPGNRENHFTACTGSGCLHDLVGGVSQMTDEELGKKNTKPACFGDEVKFVAYMENQAADSECARCSCENDCGEYILLKCCRETMF